MSQFYPKISYSALNRFERCHMAYRLRREGKKSPMDQRWVMDGNALHAGLRAKLTGVPDDPVEHALSFWSMRVREEAVRWSAEERTEHFYRVQAGMETLVGLIDDLKAEVSGSLVSEVHLVYLGKGWGMEGYIDLYVRGEGGYEIWDLKSGKWHIDQLVFYDVLGFTIKQKAPRRVGIIEPLGRGLVTQPVTDEAREDMRGRIQAMAQAVVRGDFDPTGYSDACHMCQSKPWCPKWDKAREGTFEA